MKKDIHPQYVECTIACTCGAVYHTRSTKPSIHVEICASCHPFFTGQQRIVDTAGRVEKFRRKYARPPTKSSGGAGPPHTKDVGGGARKKPST